MPALPDLSFGFSLRFELPAATNPDRSIRDDTARMPGYRESAFLNPADLAGAPVGNRLIMAGAGHHTSSDRSYQKACIVDTNRQCYFSIAAFGADGGRARDSGEKNNWLKNFLAC